MRIGGLASGMDIDQIVKDLMKAERLPLDTLKQKQQILQWQRDDYRSMNTLLLNFRQEITNMRSSSMFRVRTTSSTDDSKVSATASSAASKSTHTISKVSQLAKSEVIKNAGSLGAINSSNGLYSEYANFSSKPTGGIDALWKNGAVLSKTIKTSAAGTEFTLGDTVTNKNDLESWSVKVDGVGFKVVTEAELGSGTLASDQVLVKSDGSMTFGKTINQGSNIKVDYVADYRTDTINIGEKTNSVRLGAGAINSVNSFFLKTKTEDGTEDSKEYNVAGNRILEKGTGTEVGTLDLNTGTISFNESFPRPEKDSKTAFSIEVKYDHKYTAFGIDTHTSKGERHETFLVSGSESFNSIKNRVNASTTGVSMFYDSETGNMTLSRTETGDFNKDKTNNGGNEIKTSGILMNEVFQFGAATVQTEAKNVIFEMNGLELERASNSVQIDGVTFTIKQVFDEAVSVNVSNDNQKAFENIVGFVNKYNELIDKMNSKISEDRYRKYKPLTDEEREGMSEKQQELWDEKAKSGLLRRDSIISGSLSQMRMDFYTPVRNGNVSSSYDHLSKIGIDTSVNYLEGGKLVINESKLKEALEKDPESVENLFIGENGILPKLFKTTTDSMDKVRNKAGNSNTTNQQFVMGRELDDIEKRVDRFEDRLISIENRYWRQFTAMEQAVQRANQQSAYLMQAFGG